ncbi:hypothetical protein FKW77_000028 [Venturia effusa]|uniref:Plastocyanin-like domain-containing protein n=1 Tax=Venturia effusa TaxID=50376 RepID=A0A517L0M6_9PEZI|nr:hypothetical protein FKW77_000028 [Venturia effusa]
MTRHLILATSLLAAFAAAEKYPWLSPVYDYFFQFPLPIPPIKSPIFTASSRETGLPIDYYEVDIKPLFAQKYPNLAPTRLVGYDGIVPGPQFRMTQNREAIVRFINHGDRANSVHLHGSFSRAPFDGPMTLLKSSNLKTVDHTAENAYFGQAGAYILHDSEEQSLGIPQGQYDIPLGLASKRYHANGSLWDPEVNREETSLYGDVFEV